MFEVTFNSFLLVALTEMGDKTQLLAFVLASRFKKPWTVLSGILIATMLNHLVASYLGKHFSSALSPDLLRWILATVFIAFAVWILFPDKEDEKTLPSRWGAFGTTLITFFLAEMGDKTQLSTVALAAKYQSIIWVTLGTTLGMLASDGLAVVFGKSLSERVPMKWVRWISAILFVIFGVGILIGS